MPGETNLTCLLANMSPLLLEPDYVFCHFSQGQFDDYIHLNPLAYFVEAEGISVILERVVAENQNIAFSAVFKCITLQVHSSLEAVGLTAAVASKLADYDISANVVAAYYHDYVFVPALKAEQTITLLRAFSE
ncbi:ACT domain-containing protein [Neptunicella sp.]|uniref:ACT domain-containing protein n=1 Tax=Neptunicella sp. TaxID=2125986 RepID=UPI003F68D2A5